MIRSTRSTLVLASTLLGLVALAPATAAAATPCSLGCDKQCDLLAKECRNMSKAEAKADLLRCLGFAKGDIQECRSEFAENLAGCLGLCPDQAMNDVCVDSQKDISKGCLDAAKADIKSCKTDAKAQQDADIEFCEMEHQTCLGGC